MGWRQDKLFCEKYIKIVKILILLFLLAALAVVVQMQYISYLSGLKEQNNEYAATIKAQNIVIDRLEDKEAKYLEELAAINESNKNFEANGKTFIGKVTAYTPFAESTGKSPGHPAFGITRSGWPVGYGVCAVDTHYWPLGTVFYIEGYGFCVAADTGGAIKGYNRFDVYIAIPGNEELSVKVARDWGVRWVKVHVISVPK